MTIDSQILVSPSTKTGTLAAGEIFRNSLCLTFKSTSKTSNDTFFSLSTMRVHQAYGQYVVE